VKDAPDLTVRRRAATVTAVDTATGTASVMWADGATSTDGVPYLDTYTPEAGDVALVDLVAGSPLILGRTASAGAGLVQADVTTGETTASTTYVALTTAGPAVANVTMRAGETVMVYVSFKGNNASGAGHAAVMSFAVSGADTRASQDVDSAENDDSVTATVGRWTVYTAATAGLHTFTAQYKTVASGTSTFANRRIIVRRN
jgi:hypothetical protein